MVAIFDCCMKERMECKEVRDPEACDGQPYSTHLPSASYVDNDVDLKWTFCREREGKTAESCTEAIHVVPLQPSPHSTFECGGESGRI
jgi:hypothetical protein